MTLRPVLHKDIPMGTRVRPKALTNFPTFTGEVVGVAMTHVLFSYIVLLDEPMSSDHGDMRAIVVPGTILESIDGEGFETNESPEDSYTKEEIESWVL